MENPGIINYSRQKWTEVPFCTRMKGDDNLFFHPARKPIIHLRQAVIMIRKSGIERNSTLPFGRRNSLSKCHPNINNRISFSPTSRARDRTERGCKTTNRPRANYASVCSVKAPERSREVGCDEAMVSRHLDRYL